MRLFIAIDLDDEKAYFAEMQDKLRNIDGSLSFPKSFHITLRFIGEFDENKADIIKNAMKSVAFRQFDIFLSGIGIFPNEKYIKIIWIGAKPTEKINMLKNEIDKALEQLNFKPYKSFKVHITLARVKSISYKKPLLECISSLHSDEKKISVKSFKLIKSTLTPEGPRYEDIAVFYSS